jgi:hypothetical protein
MGYRHTPEQDAILEHHVRLGDYPSKEAALDEAFRRFKIMLDEEKTEHNRALGSNDIEK